MPCTNLKKAKGQFWTPSPLDPFRWDGGSSIFLEFYPFCRSHWPRWDFIFLRCLKKTAPFESLEPGKSWKFSSEAGDGGLVPKIPTWQLLALEFWNWRRGGEWSRRSVWDVFWLFLSSVPGSSNLHHFDCWISTDLFLALYHKYSYAEVLGALIRGLHWGSSLVFLACWRLWAWWFRLEAGWERMYFSMVFLFDVCKEGGVTQVVFAAGAFVGPILALIERTFEH